MNKLPSEAKPFVEELRAAMPKDQDLRERCSACPFPIIPAMAKVMRDSRLAFGAQDVSAHESGAYTGEVSPPPCWPTWASSTASSATASAAQYHAESDSARERQGQGPARRGHHPHHLRGREPGAARDGAHHGVRRLPGQGCPRRASTPAQVKKCVIAYEPIWAIGTGRTATADQAQEVCREIRTVIREHVSTPATARAVSILYGGSMNAKNCDELLAQPDIDGGLIGGASLKPEDFARIIAGDRRRSERMENVKPTALIILDGYGIGEPERRQRHLSSPRRPSWTSCWPDCPHTQLSASGLDVGLPEGQMGNSEVGHTNIGAGRVVYQDLPRITNAVKDGSFFENPAYVKAMDDALATGGALHVLGLLSDGGVHSHITHIFAILEMAKRRGLPRVYVHCFLDGRDVEPQDRRGLRRSSSRPSAQKLGNCEDRHHPGPLLGHGPRQALGAPAEGL